MAKAKKKKPKYYGKFVASANFTKFFKGEFIASGVNHDKVIKKAHKKGVKNPVMFFVLKRGVRFLLARV